MAKQKFLNLHTEVVWRRNFIVIVQLDENSKNEDVYITIFKNGEQYEADALGNLDKAEYEEIIKHLQEEKKLNLVKY